MILIRVDASFLIGTGHVVRCRTLARQLKQHGRDVVFLCRVQTGDMIEMLRQEFQVVSLKAHTTNESSPSPASVATVGGSHAHWLGTSQTQDANDCIDALEKLGLETIEWIVVDHYGLDATWETMMLAYASRLGSTAKLLVIDDLADRTHECHILLDQNLSGDAASKRYAHLVPESCQLLLGPHHALLTPEYAEWQKSMPKRNALLRVLIYFGGGDTSRMTASAITALNLKEFSNIHLDVVYNHQADRSGLVQQAAANRPQTTVYQPLPSLGPLIARADLGIGAAGSTTWERCCLGLPSLLLVLDENQDPVAVEALRGGAALCLGSELDEARMLQWITQLNPQRLERMSRCCMDICDGRGVGRMIHAMNG